MKDVKFIKEDSKSLKAYDEISYAKHGYYNIRSIRIGFLERRIMYKLIRYNENGVFKIYPKDNENYWPAIGCAGITRDLVNKLIEKKLINKVLDQEA